MKAPDKIYVREFTEGLSQIWSGIRATETSATAQHEYISKDALLEWINEMREKHQGFTDAEFVVTFDKLTEKINSF